jgi:hypothetical protein
VFGPGDELVALASSGADDALRAAIVGD